MGGGAEGRVEGVDGRLGWRLRWGFVVLGLVIKTWRGDLGRGEGGEVGGEGCGVWCGGRVGGWVFLIFSLP